METKNKIAKLRKMVSEAVAKKEIAVNTVYSALNERMDDNTTDEKFDILLVLFMNERAQFATTLLKKKNNALAEQEIYSLSLLSITFLNGRKKPYIEGNKIKIKND